MGKRRVDKMRRGEQETQEGTEKEKYRDKVSKK